MPYLPWLQGSEGDLGAFTCHVFVSTGSRLLASLFIRKALSSEMFTALLLTPEDQEDTNLGTRLRLFGIGSEFMLIFGFFAGFTGVFVCKGLFVL